MGISIVSACDHRTIAFTLYCSEHFKDFDPFEKQKQKALTDSFDAIVALLSHLADELATIGDVNDMDALERMFVQLLEVRAHMFSFLSNENK